MAKILNASIDTNLGGSNASNEVISSQLAIKTYVDNAITVTVTSDTDGDVILGTTSWRVSDDGNGNVTIN